MNDKELLELAAKAAGMTHTDWVRHCCRAAAEIGKELK